MTKNPSRRPGFPNQSGDVWHHHSLLRPSPRRGMGAVTQDPAPLPYRRCGLFLPSNNGPRPHEPSLRANHAREYTYHIRPGAKIATISHKWNPLFTVMSVYRLSVCSPLDPIPCFVREEHRVRGRQRQPLRHHPPHPQTNLSFRRSSPLYILET